MAHRKLSCVFVSGCAAAQSCEVARWARSADCIIAKLSLIIPGLWHRRIAGTACAHVTNRFRLSYHARRIVKRYRCPDPSAAPHDPSAAPRPRRRDQQTVLIWIFESAIVSGQRTKGHRNVRDGVAAALCMRSRRRAHHLGTLDVQTLDRPCRLRWTPLKLSIVRAGCLPSCLWADEAGGTSWPGDR